MAHNIHFIAVYADSHKEAEESAMLEIEDWGDENNWRTYIGSVDKNNNIHNTVGFYASRRWDMCNLENIEHTLKSTMKKQPYKIVEGMDKSIQLYINYKNAKHAYKTYLDHPLDIWKDEIYGWQFDEVGITNISYNDKANYIVAIDMHS